jgi:hypothetical protein
MLNTISECNEELSKLDSELARLKLERQHVLAVRRLLENHKGTSLISRRGLKGEIYKIVAENPGIDGIGVREILNDDSLTPRQVTWNMSDMRRTGKLENRGGRGRAARWYIKENY